MPLALVYYQIALLKEIISDHNLEALVLNRIKVGIQNHPSSPLLPVVKRRFWQLASVFFGKHTVKDLFFCYSLKGWRECHCASRWELWMDAVQAEGCYNQTPCPSCHEDFFPLFEPDEATELGRLADELDDDKITPCFSYELVLTEKVLRSAADCKMDKNAPVSYSMRDGTLVMDLWLIFLRCAVLLSTLQNASRPMELIVLKRMMTVLGQGQPKAYSDSALGAVSRVYQVAGQRLKDLLEIGENDERIGLWLQLVKGMNMTRKPLV